MYDAHSFDDSVLLVNVSQSRIYCSESVECRRVRRAEEFIHTLVSYFVRSNPPTIERKTSQALDQQQFHQFVTF